MRFYAKLIVIVAAFAWLCSATGRRMTGNLAFEARVALVYSFGTAADRERLIEYTGRLRAAQDGCLEYYLARERLFKQIGTSADFKDDGSTMSNLAHAARGDYCEYRCTPGPRAAALLQRLSSDP